VNVSRAPISRRHGPGRGLDPWESPQDDASGDAHSGAEADPLIIPDGGPGDEPDHDLDAQGERGNGGTPRALSAAHVIADGIFAGWDLSPGDSIIGRTSSVDLYESIYSMKVSQSVVPMEDGQTPTEGGDLSRPETPEEVRWFFAIPIGTPPCMIALGEFFRAGDSDRAPGEQASQ
jgi:hypothetical protein